MLRGTIVNHTDMHAGRSKKHQMLKFFHFRICLQQILKMGTFHVQRAMMKNGYFCNFEKEDNGKSLSTFVMQLSAPHPCSAQKNEMRKFHFPHHSHHSYIQTVMCWSMETLMIKRLKCFLIQKVLSHLSHLPPLSAVLIV